METHMATYSPLVSLLLLYPSCDGEAHGGLEGQLFSDCDEGFTASIETVNKGSVFST